MLRVALPEISGQPPGHRGRGRQSGLLPLQDPVQVGIFAVDSPPLWRAFDAVGTEEMGVIEQMGALAQRQLQDLRGYIAERGTILLTWVLLWIGMAVTLILMRRKARLWVQQDRSLATTVAMLDRPMTAAAVIILAVANLFDQQAPTAWFDLVNLLLLLTLLLLLFGILAKALRPLPYLLMAIFVLMRLVQLSPVASLTQRLAMLALSLVGIAFCWWFLRSLEDHPDVVPDAWRRWVARGLQLAIGLLTVGLVVVAFLLNAAPAEGAETAEAAGGDLDQVVKLTIYLTDLANFATVNRVMEDYFERPFPARAAIGVASLPKGADVEADAILGL